MAGRELDLRLHLMDHQVIDRNGRMVCKVDDLELTEDGAGNLVVTAIILGPRALGPRLGGRLGGWVSGLAQRLSTLDRQAPPRIDFGLVTDIGTAVTVTRTVAELDVAPLESWVAGHVIDRIPGARHESE
jgi:sporulation protein YlmC with PRC-barrel domain